jgi:hypothetical protein
MTPYLPQEFSGTGVAKICAAKKYVSGAKGYFGNDDGRVRAKGCNKGFLRANSGLSSS